MKTTYSLSHAQRHLPGLVRESSEGGSIAITRHDETVAYVVSRDRMEAIVETMELLASPTAMREIRAYEQGKMKFHSFGALPDEGCDFGSGLACWQSVILLRMPYAWRIGDFTRSFVDKRKTRDD